MKFLDEQLIFSPSDLTSYLSCAHLLVLERQVAFGEQPRPQGENLYRELLARLGSEHETAYLESLRGEGLDVAQIPRG